MTQVESQAKADIVVSEENKVAINLHLEYLVV
jgi:hypothetical protein